MAFPSPSLTPPTLTNWQFSYGGLTFGHATSIKIKDVSGLGDLPTIRNGDVDRPRDQGQLIGLDLYTGRDFSIDLEAETSVGGIQATLATLSAVTLVGLTTETPMWFQVGTYPLLCTLCRPRKRTIPWDIGYEIGALGVVSTQFHSTDPRIYSAGKSATVGLPVPTAGLKFPVTFPATFGSIAPSGVTVTNNGNTEMRPILVITGPVTNPSVQNATIPGNPTLSFSNPNQTSYTVLAGDQMVVDLDAHTVEYYSGGISAGSPASRGSWVVNGSTWWDLLPGNNLVQFLSQDSASVAGTCQVQWADAYIL